MFRPRGPEFCLSGWTNVNSPYHSKGLHSLVIPKINRNRFGKKKSPHHSVHLCNEFARRHPSFCAPSVTSSIWEQYRSEPLILPNVTGISVHGLVVVSTGTTKLQFIILKKTSKRKARYTNWLRFCKKECNSQTIKVLYRYIASS